MVRDKYLRTIYNLPSLTPYTTAKVMPLIILYEYKCSLLGHKIFNGQTSNNFQLKTNTDWMLTGWLFWMYVLYFTRFTRELAKQATKLPNRFRMRHNERTFETI